jgi:hypothetical protein
LPDVPTNRRPAVVEFNKNLQSVKGGIAGLKISRRMHEQTLAGTPLKWSAEQSFFSKIRLQRDRVKIAVRKPQK